MWLLFLEVAVYFALMLVIGRVTGKWVTSSDDYWTSGREVHWLPMGFGIAAIMFSGATLPTISGFAITHGLWIGSLYMWGWALGIVLFTLLVAPAIRRAGIVTLPEWIEVRYSSKTRTVAAIATATAAFGALFAQVVGLGNNLVTITGLPYWATTLAVVILCTLYLYSGGFWALTVSDMCHMTIVAIAFLVVLAFMFAKVGGPFQVAANSPGAAERVFTFFGKSPAGFTYKLNYPSFPSLLIGWFFCQLGCQYYWARAVSARTEKEVKKGYYLSAVMTIVFGSTLLALFGTYALQIFGEGNVTSANAFGKLVVDFLPVPFDGLLTVALVAGCMSTFSTAVVGVSAPITRDIYLRIFRPKANAKEMEKASRIVTVCVAIVAYLFALFWKSGSGHALAMMWAFSAPTGALVLLGLFWKRATPKASFIAELIGLIVTFLWYVISAATPLKLVNYVHPMWVGFLLTFCLMVILSLATTPKYYGKEGYKAPQASKAAGLAQSASAHVKAYQEEQYKLAMQNSMRPVFGTRKWKEALERRHNSTTTTVADFFYPEITGRQFNSRVKAEEN
ncbi:MAG: sodium:solute symporter family protein [Lachnospiraceae bacterium]|nr:sodium:solute symporter family protein [Lachnospiraceae bacterium]